MRKIFTLFITVFLIFTTLPNNAFAADAKAELTQSNEFIDEAIKAIKADDISKVKDSYDKFNDAWKELEDGVKEQSKQAYGDIESKMGMVHFLLIQDPVQKDKLLAALEDLEKTNDSFISENVKTEVTANGPTPTVKDLVALLETAKGQIQNNDIDSAIKTMNTFSSSWLDVEGVVLTQSKKVYDDAEKDMVSAKAYLTVSPIEQDKALKVIERMHGYLSLLAGDTSYGIADVVTIILREGLEALLVVVALLGFLKKSGQETKKSWVYGGVIIGLIVSVVLAVIVKLLFTSGSFGNNNFLISGWTGVFAALMLIYVSYWLHSKSSVSQRNNKLKDKSTETLANGSLLSLGFLAFLAVFREGTETVLFYIGMASSINLIDLFLGIALGFIILIILAVLILKVGLRIPMKPFFLISSLLVFYLALKFTGMGINGLQLAGLLPATTSDLLPTISSLAVYPTWQGFIPQVLLVIIAVAVTLLGKIKMKKSL